MFSPTLRALLRLLSTQPKGITRQEAYHRLGIDPARVDHVLEELLRLGLVEERDERIVPRPQLPIVSEKMDIICRRVNQTEAARDLVRILFLEQE